MSFNFNIFEAGGVQPYLVILPGRIAGIAGPGASVSRGKKFTVSYGATGVYTVTFSEAFGSIIAVVPALEAATITDVDGWTVQMRSVSTTGFIAHTFNEANSATALPANTFLNFIAVGTNSSLT